MPPKKKQGMNADGQKTLVGDLVLLEEETTPSSSIRHGDISLWRSSVWWCSPENQIPCGGATLQLVLQHNYKES